MTIHHENKPSETLFEELSNLIVTATTEDLLRLAPHLSSVIPELKPMIGFDQRSPHHAYDLYRHTAGVTGAVPQKPVLRWAALLHDTGKVTTFTLDENGRGHFYGHAQDSARIADAVLLRLKAPTELRQKAVQLIDLHMHRFDAEKESLRPWLCRLGSQTMEDLLLLQEADLSSKGTGKERNMDQFRILRQLIEEIKAEAAQD